MFSLNKTSHRVVRKGQDKSGLGRWSWVKYRGKDNITFRVITAYRPNDSKGPLTVFAQHKLFFQNKDDDRCPRQAFLEDLCLEIEEYKQEGDSMLLMLDGNDDMRRGALHRSLSACQLRECILEKHGNKAVNTYRRNTRNVPIDGIWVSPNIEIKAGGYFAFDDVFQGTDHRTLWVDITYNIAFGHNMAPLVKPLARRLQCKDPRTVANYICKYEEIIKKHQLISRALALEEQSKQHFNLDLQKEYEEIDLIRYNAMAEAERKCRKLRMGNVDFSPTIQLAMRQIRAWSLLIKKKKGLKVSSRLLARTLKKAAIDVQNRVMGMPYLEEQLKLANRYYYMTKGNSGPL